MIEVKTQISVPDIENLKKNAISKAHKHAATEAMAWFLKERVPQRFNDRMSRELGYARRDRDWVEVRARTVRKRTFDHNHTGGTAKAAKRNAKIKATAARDGALRARLVIDDLNPGYRKRPKPGKINLNKEVTRIGAKEMTKLGAKYSQSFSKFIRTDPSVRFKRKRKTV